MKRLTLLIATMVLMIPAIVTRPVRASGSFICSGTISTYSECVNECWCEYSSCTIESGGYNAYCSNRRSACNSDCRGWFDW